jgi:Domain of unknown function (DUF3536)
VPPDGRPARYITKGGREIALFIYHGKLAHGVAFGDLLRDGIAWAERMAGEKGAPTLLSLAIDGETFGHHHIFGEMALAKAIVELRSRPDVRLENYASFLAREGAHHAVELIEPSAWSCAHGVDRWRTDCGCRADPSRETQQRWRAPLRGALEWLAEGLHSVFEREAGACFRDPWAVRDAYGAVIDVIDPSARERFVVEQITAGASKAVYARALELLEMERDALRFFTSCAWFFDDVAGLESRQVLRYAAHALERAGPDGVALREGFRERLVAAESNDVEVGTAAALFESLAGPRAEASSR